MRVISTNIFLQRNKTSWTLKTTTSCWPHICQLRLRSHGIGRIWNRTNICSVSLVHTRLNEFWHGQRSHWDRMNVALLNLCVVLRTSILRVSLSDSPGFIALSSSFQLPTVQISPEKDRFQCSHGFVKIWDRSHKKRDPIFFIANSSG